MKIRVKMILLLMILAVSIIIPISYFAIKSSQRIIIETTFDLCKNLSENISEIAREELFIDSTYEASNTVIKRLQKSNLRGLINIRLMNVNGNYVVQFNSEKNEIASDLEIEFVKSLTSLEYREMNENGKNTLRFISPVYLNRKKESFKIGAAIFDFDKDELYFPIREIQSKILILSLVILITSIVVGGFVSFLLTKPISILSEGVKIISNGNLNYQIKIKSRDEIGEFANSFNQMTHNINMANKAKDEFMSNLSHELKTPLTVVNAYAEMLMGGKDYPDKVKKYSLRIHEGSMKLNEYVNDLMLITDIESNLQLQKSKTDLQTIIEKAVEQYNPLIIEKAIQVNINIPQKNEFNCDPILLGKAISAFIKNAIVYNRQDGKVEVNLDYANLTVGDAYMHHQLETNPGMDKLLQIKITDKGIGIAKEFHEKVFEKFFRVDSSLTYEVSGVGVGLFIAKRVIELHGGVISLKSELEKGTEITLYLPMDTDNEEVG